ncbi:MAG: FG-GAP-like repeat-containing protein [Pseudomonadota bacterium]
MAASIYQQVFAGNRTRIAFALFFLVLLPPAGNADTDARLMALAASQGLDGVPDQYSSPPGPLTPLVGLGRALFFSRQLSGDRDVACASCHHPLLGGGDGLSLAVGIAAHRPEIVGPGRVAEIARETDPKAKSIGGPNVARNTLTTFNAALYEKSLLFDGRVSLLGTDETGQPLYRTPESTLRSSPDMNSTGDLLAVQARFPIVSFQEMRGFGEFYTLTAAEIRTAIAARLAAASTWLAPFRVAFGLPDASPESLFTFDRITAALSAYQQSQVFIQNAWQRYLGGDLTALSEEQKAGALLFLEPVSAGGYGCAGCHSGDFFTDEANHVTGFPQFGRGKRSDGDDPGAFLVSQDSRDSYAYRTPSLLNVTATGPYGHTGAFATLAELVTYHADPVAGFETYDFSLGHLSQFAASKNPYPAARALTKKALENLSPALPRKSPSAEETRQLVAFLGALTDPCVLSRECLQPWIAGHADDYDGHLFQPVFQRTGPYPFDVREPETPVVQAATPEAVAMPTGVTPGRITKLVACRYHDPGPVEGGEMRFIDRSRDFFSHRHLIPGHMWYGSRYSYTVEFAMESGSLAAGDINGDCWPDLIFGTHDGTAPLAVAYLNRVSTFERRDLSLAGLPDAIGALGLADLDGDYQLDLALGNLFGARETAIFHNEGTGDFRLHQSISMSKVVFGFAFADYSGDGWLDMFAAHWDIAARPALAPALMRNNAGLLLSADAEAGTSGAELEQNFHFSPGFADFDGDGDMDLVIASDFGTSEVLENGGAGRFSVITDHTIITDENGMGSAIADFDNDLVLDWFVTAIYKEDDGTRFNWGETGNRLYGGTGTGLTFEDRTDAAGVRQGSWGWGTCAADFNNDSWTDIFHENGFGLIPEGAASHIPEYIYRFMPTGLSSFHRVQPRLYINRGDGSFEDQAEAWGLTELTNGRGVVCLDYDRDGDIDLAVAQNSDVPKLYENRSRSSEPGSNHFVGFHLIGSQPNTSAVGAIVTLDTGDMKQVRHVQMNSNFQGQNPSTVHFGLGQSTRIQRLTVRWPDGEVDQLADIAPDRYYPLLHPSLRAAVNRLAD